ncbi:uncharacterized protein LOC119980963 [Tripterygium wilfordii]|uniref:uncharacterized protein LOC119980963 n=1 Tax=Tripterygium wilfordii TaxID=458696 RepID=UPI0018F8554C|nr:uncharacterized protein LOC119980963 [Tripterygium wilfordii]
MAAPDMTMKLLIDTRGRRVLYAEAGKDVVDFLFSILSLPLGSATRLLTSNEMVGSVGNLYLSIKDLNDAYMLPKKKEMLLNPVLTNPIAANAPLLMPTNHQPSTKKPLYRCCKGNGQTFSHSASSFSFGPSSQMSSPSGRCDPYVTYNFNERCPNCNNLMNSNVKIVGQVEEGSSSFEGGLVQGLVTYMIMDDLVVKPLSTISSIDLFHIFNVKEMGSLEEKKVNLTMGEGKKLLKASLQSKTVLTDIFFEEKMFAEEKISMDSVD